MLWPIGSCQATHLSIIEIVQPRVRVILADGLDSTSSSSPYMLVFILLKLKWWLSIRKLCQHEDRKMPNLRCKHYLHSANNNNSNNPDYRKLLFQTDEAGLLLVLLSFLIILFLLLGSYLNQLKERWRGLEKEKFD